MIKGEVKKLLNHSALITNVQNNEQQRIRISAAIEPKPGYFSIGSEHDKSTREFPDCRVFVHLIDIKIPFYALKVIFSRVLPTPEKRPINPNLN
jgi:hypothetical protein